MIYAEWDIFYEKMTLIFAKGLKTNPFLRRFCNAGGNYIQ